MCEKSPLQKLWKPKSGDWVVRKYSNTIVEKNKQEVQILIRDIASGKNTYWVIVNEDGESRLTQGELHKKLFTCLFRQDQLQKMYEPSGLSDFMLYMFWDFLTKEQGEYAINNYARLFNSMEQLWHAFVVYKLHKKIWDDKKGWVVKEDK
jgi:hypothetical protein